MIRRACETEVLDSLSDTPVVLIHGPRQCGKSTLAKAIGEKTGAAYLTLDDPIPRSLAVEDPVGFLKTYPGPVIIDEVQRAPNLFLAIKSAVDKDRKAGRFLLTGSANVLALPKIADSLAGRMAVIDLLPLSQAEIEGASSNFLDRIFEPNLNIPHPPVASDLFERIVKGGFPEPMQRASASRRDAWFADYVRTILERDVRDLANIEGLVQMPRVLRLLAARTGEALNVLGLSRDTQIPNTSLQRYLDLLHTVFLIQTVPAWSDDDGARLTKTPKSYVVDSGLQCYLSNQTVSSLKSDEERSKLTLKSFVAMELKRLRAGSQLKPDLYHLRTVRRLEVDFVLENRAREVVGLQVKCGETVRPQDADGLQFLQELAGDRFKRGVVLYTGAEVQPLGPDILALPLNSLWAV